MKKSLRFIIFLQTMAIFIASCNVVIINQNNKNEGLLTIEVKFTEKTFGVKIIPSEIEKINIEISGECLKNKIKLTTSYKNPKVIINMVKGMKHISVKAIYSNRIVAYGENSVFVYPCAKNSVEVNLINACNYKTTPVPSTSTDITSSPIITTPSVIPTTTATANPTPSPSSSSSGYLKSSSTYSSNMNAQLNIISSTPIPSGVTVE